MGTPVELSDVAAKDLLSKDKDQLYELLGLRLQGTSTDLQLQGTLNPDIEYGAHMGPMEDLKAIGVRMFNKLQKQAYALVCGNDPDDAADRNKIIAAMGIGTESAVIVLTSILIGTFGVAAALAGVVAALIIKRFAIPTLSEGQSAMCELWKENLPD